MRVITRRRSTMLLRRAVSGRGQQIVAAWMLCCYLFVLLGVPAAGPAGLAMRGGPYPCQDGACGCQSASQCWGSCCCYTDRQKLAWAEANGVTPPGDFLRRVAAVGLTRPRQSSPEGVSRVTRTAACCQTAESPQQAVAACCRAPRSEAATTASAANRVVITIAALKCRGLAGDWTGLPAYVPLAAAERWPLERLLTQLPLAAAPRMPELCFPPPSPPPRN